MEALSENIKSNKEDFINEFNLEFESIKYIIKIGKSSNSDDLIIYIKEENLKSPGYQNSFTLEKLQKINKYFKIYDKIDEILEFFKDIISNKKLFIKKTNEKLTVIFNIKKMGKDEEEVDLELKKIKLETEKIENKQKENYFINKIKNIAKKAGIKLIFMALILCYSLPKLSCIDYSLVTITLLYLISPIDLIPDTIPIIGYLDDLYLLRITFKRIMNSLKRLQNNSKYIKEIKLQAKNKLHSIFEDIDEKMIEEFD